MGLWAVSKEEVEEEGECEDGNIVTAVKGERRRTKNKFSLSGRTTMNQYDLD